MTDPLDDLYHLNYHENQKANQLLRQHLPQVEHFIWTGRPVQGPVFRLAYIGNILLGLLVLVLGFFFAFVISVLGTRFLGKLFFILTCGACLYLCVGPFLWNIFQRYRTAYGLTNDGLYILQGKTVAFHPSEAFLHSKIHRQRSNGIGVISYQDYVYPAQYITQFTEPLPHAYLILRYIQQITGADSD